MTFPFIQSPELSRKISRLRETSQVLMPHLPLRYLRSQCITFRIRVTQITAHSANIIVIPLSIIYTYTQHTSPLNQVYLS
jgi:hypothetical protein